MKTAHSFFALLFAFVLCLAIACDGVTVDPTGMGVTVQLDPAASTIGPADLQFTEGFLNISEIEFEGEKEDESEIELEVEQLTTIDLATGVATPALPIITIPAGVYEEFELEVSSVDDGETVIFLKGTFVDSSQAQVPIEVDIQESFSLELEWENYTVDSTTTFGATFLIDPLVWFQSITDQELNQADRDANGTVIISPTNNPDLYAKLISIIPEGIEWEWDD